MGYKQKLNDVDEAIQANAQFLNEVVDSPEIFANMDIDLSDDQVQGEEDPELSDVTAQGRLFLVIHFDGIVNKSSCQGKVCSTHTAIHIPLIRTRTRMGKHPPIIINLLIRERLLKMRRNDTGRPISIWINLGALSNSSFVTGALRSII